MITAGIDLGGTKMAAGLVDDDGTIMNKISVPRPRDPAGMEAAPMELAEQILVPGVEALGLGVAGLVREDGVMVWGPNVVGENIPYRTLLSERFDLPVCVDNDANVAALAEARIGASQAYRYSVMITLGTGIGGGLIVDREIYRGASFAGEIGHVIVDVGGPTCTCGQRGCWETFASGRRLDQIARDVAAEHPTGLVAQLAGDANPNGVHLTDAALDGDRVAQDRIGEMGTWLGIGMANLIAILDPEIIVIGGGASRAGELLLDPARSATWQALEGSAHRPEIPIVGAALGADAGLIGAAIAAKEMVQ